MSARGNRERAGNGHDGTRRCIVLHPVLRSAGQARRDPGAALAEAVGLAEVIDLDVVESQTVPLQKPRPATLIGAGVVDRIKSLVHGNGDAEHDDATPMSDSGKASAVELVVIDAALTPVQQRNLERAWNCKVIDRTGLILEIFGARARTREGRLQVELAALSYARSRLVRSWTHLERQRGGLGFVGGPGETQIESDRRQIGERILRIKRALARVKRTRVLHRKARRRVPYPIVALVGYTNAGKSTLFNALTRAAVKAQDQLFTTLDPTMRGLTLASGRRTILADTVGFISDLPHELVAAFHATLEEVIEADVIVHVRDISHPDSAAQKEDVVAVLHELGVNGKADREPVEVLNKADLLTPEAKAVMNNRIARGNVDAVIVSALSGEGLEALSRMLDYRLKEDRGLMTVIIAPEDGRSLAWLYDHGEVVTREDSEEGILLTVRLNPSDAAWFSRLTPDTAQATVALPGR